MILSKPPATLSFSNKINQSVDVAKKRIVNSNQYYVVEFNENL